MVHDSDDGTRQEVPTVDELERRLEYIQGQIENLTATVNVIHRLAAEAVGRCWCCNKYIRNWPMKIDIASRKELAALGINPSTGHDHNCPEDP